MILGTKRPGIAPREATVIGVALTAILAVAAVYFLASGHGGAQTSPISSSQANQGTVLMSLGQTPRMLGPGITLNYTLTITPSADATGEAYLTSDGPQGLGISLNPTKVNLAGSEIAVDVSVHASDSVVPGSYDVGFKIAWGASSSNLTYHFTIVRHMVLLVGGFVQAGGFDPQTINIHTGDSVVWLSVDPGGDEFGGLRQVRVVEANVTSPTLSLYSTWSYVFTQAGTYHIEDPLNQLTVPEGTVVVS